MVKWVTFLKEYFAFNPIIIVLILFTAAIVVYKVKFAPFNIKKSLKAVAKEGVSPLFLSLASTVGTGNIAGVAYGIIIGGAGAVFWMVAGAFFCMAIKYAEGFLAVKYKRENLCGAFCYIEEAFCSKKAAKIYAFFGLFAGLIGIGTFVQINSITLAFNGLFTHFGYIKSSNEINFFCGFLVAVITAFIIFGGGKRIIKFTNICVPVMATVYIMVSCFIIIANITLLPAAILKIIKSGLSFKAFAGGSIGIVIKEGFCKGVSSNEAGLGTATFLPNDKNYTDCKSYGLMQSFSVFIDTVIICSLTGIVVVICNKSGYNGIDLISACWQSTGIFSCPVILFLCLILFAFTSIIGWCYYGEKCFKYLFNIPAFFYRTAYIIAVFTGAFIKSDVSWCVAEICNTFMIIPNLTAIIKLGVKK